MRASSLLPILAILGAGCSAGPTGVSGNGITFQDAYDIALPIARAEDPTMRLEFAFTGEADPLWCEEAAQLNATGQFDPEDAGHAAVRDEDSLCLGDMPRPILDDALGDAQWPGWTMYWIGLADSLRLTLDAHGNEVDRAEGLGTGDNRVWNILRDEDVPVAAAELEDLVEGLRVEGPVREISAFFLPFGGRASWNVIGIGTNSTYLRKEFADAPVLGTIIPGAFDEMGWGVAEPQGGASPVATFVIQENHTLLELTLEALWFEGDVPVPPPAGDFILTGPDGTTRTVTFSLAEWAQAQPPFVTLEVNNPVGGEWTIRYETTPAGTTPFQYQWCADSPEPREPQAPRCTRPAPDPPAPVAPRAVLAELNLDVAGR